MIKTVTGLQTLDMEVGILLELHSSFSDDIHLLSGLKASFGKDYTSNDLNNLKRYHKFINCHQEFEGLAEFSFERCKQITNQD